MINIVFYKLFFFNILFVNEVESITIITYFIKKHSFWKFTLLYCPLILYFIYILSFKLLVRLIIYYDINSYVVI